MTTEERNEKLANIAELRAKVDALVLDVDAANMMDTIDGVVDEYTSAAQDLCFCECMDAEDPMVEACTRKSFLTIAVKDISDKDDTIPIMAVQEIVKEIPLLKLNKWSGGIGHNGSDGRSWVAHLESYNMRVAAKVATDIGAVKDGQDITLKSLSDTFAMSKLAREIEMGKTPLSNTALMKALSELVKAMIGDSYTATAKDREYVLYTWGKRSRGGGKITAATHKVMASLMMDVCHKLITGEPYGMDYKERKKK